MHTPASVHDGSWVIIEARRAATLDAAYRAHPERFRRRHRPREMPARAWINEPAATPKEASSPQTTQAGRCLI
jgi:putative transposase